ncbi:MAG: hypothetical protein K0R52_1401 [Alphaproteobacteria bacterium]|jgi:hypothetical protein|nr:hypothetical protein [Alphaproteobacteria bacterium]
MLYLYKLKYLLIAGLFLINVPSIKSAEAVDNREHITPENSSIVFYRLAHTAFVELCFDDTTSLWHKLTIGGSFLGNVLDRGMHPGIPEKDWPWRVDDVEQANQVFLKKIAELYRRYTYCDGISFNCDHTGFDGRVYPYLTYDPRFQPQGITWIADLFRKNLFSVISAQAFDGIWYFNVNGKWHITPENSTPMFLWVAETAFNNLSASYDDRDQKVPVDGKMPAWAKNVVTISYKTNVLGHGMHPDIAEGSWPLRGWVKWGNHQLLKKMIEVYRGMTDCNGITFKYGVPGFDEIAHPYIIYALGFTPVLEPQVSVAAPEVRLEKLFTRQ